VQHAARPHGEGVDLLEKGLGGYRTGRLKTEDLAVELFACGLYEMQQNLLPIPPDPPSGDNRLGDPILVASDSVPGAAHQNTARGKNFSRLICLPPIALDCGFLCLVATGRVGGAGVAAGQHFGELLRRRGAAGGTERCAKGYCDFCAEAAHQNTCAQAQGISASAARARHWSVEPALVGVPPDRPSQSIVVFSTVVILDWMGRVGGGRGGLNSDQEGQFTSALIPIQLSIADGT
jgi:hypothetical protein